MLYTPVCTVFVLMTTAAGCGLLMIIIGFTL
jgi:hypothetical protein